MKTGLLLLAVCATACAREEYGYLARLGTDTMAIEWITRNGNTITSDVVERSPRVIRKRWQGTLNSDGTLERWTMDKQIVNPRPGETRELHYAAEFGSDSVLVHERGGGETRAYLVRDVLPVTLPWESDVYGLYDLLFAAALRQTGDSIPVRQYQPGEGVGRGVVHRQSGDSLTFVTTGLAGTGSARMDGRGRMLSYSGRFTTSKQEVERLTEAPDLDAIVERFAAHEKASPARSLSVRDTTRAAIGGAAILIDYSRPLRRGRNILGNVVPYDVVWRTGANAATQFTTTEAITVAGLKLAPGTYTLWTLPTRDGRTQLIINRQSGQWGTRYNPRMDLGRAPLQIQSLAEPIDTFTIRVDPGQNPATLVLEWDRFRWSAPIGAAD